ncbi:MAG: nucleotidyltransferase family protein [Chloroflexi bacterium]|nr:nucleotidyltransferase family protein [Chloroflexota bacterium]
MTSATAWEHLLTLVAAGEGPVPAIPDDECDDLIAMAGRHRLLPLVYRRSRKHACRSLPPAVEQTLHRAYLLGVVANRRIYHHLARLLGAANESGLPIVVLKGACLAEVVYGDVALRPMTDLDLLFRWHDLPRLDYLTCSLGYTRPDGDLVALAEAGARHHFPILRQSNGPPLELHWTIAHEDRHGVFIDQAEIEALWSRSLPMTIAGVATRMLAPEDLLLHSCLHLANNHLFAWAGLRGLVDLSLTVKKYGHQLGWDAVERRARTWGAWHGVSLALWLARDWLGAPIPDPVAARLLAALPPDDMVGRVREKMCQPAPASLNVEIPPTLADRRLRDTPARLVRSLFPSRRTLAGLYRRPADSARLYLYYPRRLFDAVRVYGRFAYRQLGGDRDGHLLAKREAALRRWLREESYGRS